MELNNQWDNKYCLAKFNKFVLHSTDISDSSKLSQIFILEDPGSPDKNPSISLVAEANSIVVSSNCKLSNKDNPSTFVEFCKIPLQIEAFINTVSFGNYISFDFYVYNECKGI
jgi:uncharacterized protein YcgI (DUF1989 family)